MVSRHLSHPHYRRDIDGLRAVAILSVVAFHAFPEWVRGGFVGVDVFFVISGYLIATIIYTNLQQGTFRFSEFYARRVCRIFPALLVMLTVCMTYGWIVLMPKEYSELGKHLAGAASFSSNLILWREAGYFDAASVSKPVLHLWSLGIEEQFYLLFPLFVYLSFRKRFLVLPFLLGFTALSFFMAVIHGTADPVGTFYSPLTRFWELLGGSLLAYSSVNTPVDAKNTLPWIRDLSSTIGLVAIACAMLGSYDEGAFPLWQCLLAVTGSILLIHTGPLAVINRTVLSNRFMVWTGIISYPLYLWHWPLLSYQYILTVAPPTTELRMAAVDASFILAWLTHYFIEKPLCFGYINRTKVTTLCLLMMTIGCIGYGIYQQNGFTNRFPKNIQQLIQITPNYHEEWREHRCFLQKEDQNTLVFNAECTDTSSRPMIVIWGDSAGAMLYPGFKNLTMEKRYAITQYTASRCPPLLDYERNDRPYCDELNNSVIQSIKDIKPDYVVLASNWNDISYDVRKLERTIAVLKQLAVPRIIVIGPFPIWKKSLSSILFHHWKESTFHQLPPRYLPYGFYPNFQPLEFKIRHISSQSRIDYISAYNLLCNRRGCLTQLGNGNDTISYVDHLHLSPAASVYFVNAIAGYFSAPPPAAAH